VRRRLIFIVKGYGNQGKELRTEGIQSLEKRKAELGAGVTLGKKKVIQNLDQHTPEGKKKKEVCLKIVGTVTGLHPQHGGGSRGRGKEGKLKMERRKGCH